VECLTDTYRLIRLTNRWICSCFEWWSSSRII